MTVSIIDVRLGVSMVPSWQPPSTFAVFECDGCGERFCGEGDSSFIESARRARAAGWRFPKGRHFCGACQ